MTHLGTAEDVTSDPFADPGQMTKHSWAKGIGRVLEGNDEEE